MWDDLRVILKKEFPDHLAGQTLLYPIAICLKLEQVGVNFIQKLKVLTGELRNGSERGVLE
ncbi:hypothetical protein GHT06_010526 [Daphnia sinensis]|uniref:Uncharacterized protein n=1 Tax=Daphnia sinensis TaxID=1820382 RepID=A0AAD5Q0G0_9CRUS|nr:hypothetical protein GHT06_010526 [Daphnia sinensis]